MASEEIISEETKVSDHPRRIRVYKGKDEDFWLDLPAGTRITFGYFNPASAGKGTAGYDDRYGSVREMRTTCLRIYRGKGNTDQLAAFLGINGFRDESIKLTKLVQRVTVERRMTDDGEGNSEYSGFQNVERSALPEFTHTIQGDPEEEIPF